MGVLPIDWKVSCSDGFSFFKLVCNRFDRRARKHEEGEDKSPGARQGQGCFILIGCKSKHFFCVALIAK